MSSDFTLVDPQGWEWDLHSVYSAYLGHFQLHNVPWYDRSWGHLFSTFEAFLQFGWPVITVTDASTFRPHIVTRTNSIGAFLKMVKTRFGESLPQVDNMIRVTPFETHQRHLRTIYDAANYRKVHATLPAAALATFKIRVKAGDHKAIKEVWDKHDKTFLALGFEWSERNVTSCLEWGYAAMRCSHLDAAGVWPPDPNQNYRKGHYIVAEYVDRVHNRLHPTFPWEYAWGESQVVPKAKLGEIIQAVIQGFLSPDSETQSNTLVLVTHGSYGDIERLHDLKIKLPSNVLVIDTASYERQLFAAGNRGVMNDPVSGKPRSPGSPLSFNNLLRTLRIDADSLCRSHNSGNDAFMTLLALQLLMEPERTQIPIPKRTMALPYGYVGPAYPAMMHAYPMGAMIPPAIVAPVPVPMPPPPPPSGYMSTSMSSKNGLRTASPARQPSPAIRASPSRLDLDSSRKKSFADEGRLDHGSGLGVPPSPGFSRRSSGEDSLTGSMRKMNIRP